MPPRPRGSSATCGRDVAGMTRDVEPNRPPLPRQSGRPGALEAGAEPDEHARALFDAADRARDVIPDDASMVALTVYDNAGVPRGWAGRASDLTLERTRGPASLFVTPSPLGLRLVHLEPVVSSGPDRARLGAVAVEHSLTSASAESAFFGASAYTRQTPRGPVSLRPHGQTDGPPFEGPGTTGFLVTGPDGAPLLDVSIAYADLAALRQRLRRGVAAIALVVFAATLLLLAGPLLDRRASAASAVSEVRLTLSIVAVIAAGAGGVVGGLCDGTLVHGQRRAGARFACGWAASRWPR